MKSLIARGNCHWVFRAVVAVVVLVFAGAIAEAQCQSGGGTFPPSGFGGGGTGPTAGFRSGSPRIGPLQTFQFAQQMQQIRRRAFASAMRRRQSMQQRAQRRQWGQSRQYSRQQFRRSSSAFNTAAGRNTTADHNRSARAGAAADKSLSPRERRQARIRERQQRLKAFRDGQRRKRDEYRQRRSTSGP
ncbi:MAG: hypothetical protein ACE5KM_01140 [Planctomycetaceae bacterium]